MSAKYFYSYRINNSIIRSENAVDYNTAREQCSWYWRNENAASFAIYDENSTPVMMRIRGAGTISKGIPYTNR